MDLTTSQEDREHLLSHLKEAAASVLKDTPARQTCCDGLEGAFESSLTSHVDAANKIAGVIRHIEVGTYFADNKKERDGFVDELGKAWLGFMGELALDGRIEEVVAVSRRAARVAEQNGRFVHVAGGLWSSTVCQVARRDMGRAKEMICAAHCFSEPLDWTVRGIVANTAKALGLDVNQVVREAPARCASIYTANPRREATF